MFEFIDTYVEPDDVHEMLHIAGVEYRTYIRWRDKRATPRLYSCILVSKAISKIYDLDYDTLILQCIKYVIVFT